MQQDSAETHLETGIAAQQAGQLRPALTHYNHAIAAAPDDALGYHLRGSLYLKLRRPLDALRDFDRSITLAPYNEIGYLGKGHVFVMLEDYRWAIVQYSRAISYLPDDAPELGAYYRDRAKAYTLAGDRVSAENDRRFADHLDQAQISPAPAVERQAKGAAENPTRT